MNFKELLENIKYKFEEFRLKMKTSSGKDNISFLEKLGEYKYKLGKGFLLLFIFILLGLIINLLTISVINVKNIVAIKENNNKILQAIEIIKNNQTELKNVKKLNFKKSDVIDKISTLYFDIKKSVNKDIEIGSYEVADGKGINGTHIKMSLIKLNYEDIEKILFLTRLYQNYIYIDKLDIKLLKNEKSKISYYVIYLDMKFKELEL